MNTVLILGAIQALFLSLLVTNKKGKNQADRILIGMLIFMALHQLFFMVNFNEQIHLPFLVMLWGGCFPFLNGPILYWYVLSLIREKPVGFWDFFLHSLPFLVFGLIFTVYHYFIQGAEVKVFDGYLHIYGEWPTPVRFYSIFFAISGGAYPLMSLWLLFRHRRSIRSQFSYEEEINLNWLSLIIIITFAGFIISFFAILFIVDWNWNENPRVAFYIVSVIGTLFIFFMGYFGLKQTTIFTTYDFSRIKPSSNSENQSIQYAKSGLDREKSLVIMRDLKRLMTTEKPFLDGKLALNDLARQLNVSTNHLSQAINENAEMNFFDYVNGFRVQEVKSRVNDPAYGHITLLGIGLECGFNSKSAFNKIFKNTTGQTPSEYKRSLN